MKKLTIFCDGSCVPVNPGGYGCSAYVVFEGDVSGREGVERPEPIAKAYACIGNGNGMTNNVAEYKAVIGALKWVRKNCGLSQVIEIRTDSQLVVMQINGKWACNKEHLREFRDAARVMMNGFSNLSLSWIPRAENDVADALTRLAYQEIEK